MRRIAVSLTLVASTALLIVSAYTIATATPPLGDVVAQNTITRETIITREGPLPPGPPPAEVIVRQPPPPPREEVRTPPPPSPGYAWVPGYWSWGNNEWVWVYGRWERPPERMATWVPGRCFERGSDLVCRSGHWE